MYLGLQSGLGGLGRIGLVAALASAISAAGCESGGVSKGATQASVHADAQVAGDAKAAVDVAETAGEQLDAAADEAVADVAARTGDTPTDAADLSGVDVAPDIDPVSDADGLVDGGAPADGAADANGEIAGAPADAGPPADAAATVPGCGPGKAEVWQQTYADLGLFTDVTATATGFVALSSAGTQVDVVHFDEHGSVTKWTSFPGSGQWLAASPQGQVAVLLPDATTPTATVAVFNAAGAIAKTWAVEPASPLPSEVTLVTWRGFAAQSDGVLVAGNYRLAGANVAERHGFLRKYSFDGALLWGVYAGPDNQAVALRLLSDGRIVFDVVPCAGDKDWEPINFKEQSWLLQADGAGFSTPFCLKVGCLGCPAYGARFTANRRLIVQYKSQGAGYWGPQQGAEFVLGPDGKPWSVGFATQIPMTFAGGGDGPDGDYLFTTLEGGLARLYPDGNLRWHRKSPGVFPWVFSRFGSLFRFGSLDGTAAVRRSDVFGNESCAEAVGCEGKGPADCDDGDSCTADLCAAGKCVSTQLPNGTYLASNKYCYIEE